jgi:nucleolar protein 56
MQALRKQCIEETKRRVAASVDENDAIIKAVATIDAIDDQVNGIVARVREWYALYLPEAERAISDNETFINRITTQSKDELKDEFDIDVTMGADLSEHDVNAIQRFATMAAEMYATRNDLESYIDTVMSTHCYNVKAIAGTLVGARLLKEAGSLKQLAMMPSSKIQLLGAEKALFRHLKTGAKPPRYGHLFAHPLVQGADDADRGKVARGIADKLALAARADYFGDKYIGDDLRDELEERFT